MTEKSRYKLRDGKSREYFNIKEDFCMKEIWVDLEFPNVAPGFIISTTGKVMAKDDNVNTPISTIYHSNNGYDFIQLLTEEGLRGSDFIVRYFPLDDLLAHTFIPVPDELLEKNIVVNHIDGNTRNNDLNNLEWIEFIEEWKDIPGVEGIYQISNMCRVKSIRNNIIMKNSKLQTGYQTITIRFNNTYKTYILHRLMMKLWNSVENMDELNVNHIDEDHSNNSLKNLEWITCKDNQNFGTRSQRIGEKISTPIRCVETGEIFRSQYDACVKYNLDAGSINRVVKGTQHTTGGYHWEYVNDENN